MPIQKLDLEAMYVYKVYYFFTILLFCTVISLIVGWKFRGLTGLCAFIIGFFVAYFIMVTKSNFPLPQRKVIARGMSKEILQSQSFIVIARYASQLYFYLDKPKQAINLLKKYLDAKDPLLSATLADLLLREEQYQEALNVLDENPCASDEPLLLLTRGNILQKTNNYLDAIHMYKCSLKQAKTKGLPRNGSTQITRLIQALSYKASIYHHLGECYLKLHDVKKARKHFIIGNLHLLDFTLWRKVDFSAQNQKRDG